MDCHAISGDTDLTASARVSSAVGKVDSGHCCGMELSSLGHVRPAQSCLCTPAHPSVQLWFQLGWHLVQPRSRDCSSITFPSKILRKTVNRWSFAPVSSSLLLPWSINYLQVERVCMKCCFSNQMPIVPYLVSSATLLIFLRLWTHPEILWAGPILSRTILLESRKNKGCSKEGSFSSGRWALLALVQPRKMSPAKTPIQSKV